MNELENTLYKTANELVGDIGESTDTSMSVTCEDYIEFAMRFKDKDIVFDEWRKWIEAYSAFAKYNMGGIATVYDGQAPRIYWRLRPEIFKKTEGDESILYARLLISYAPKARLLSRL